MVKAKKSNYSLLKTAINSQKNTFSSLFWSYPRWNGAFYIVQMLLQPSVKVTWQNLPQIGAMWQKLTSN